MSAEAPPEEKAPQEEIALIGYLKDLAKRQDRAALAHLRRGLARKPGESMEMFPYVGRFISEKTSAAHDRAVFLTAALFADYSDAAPNISDLGRSIYLLDEAVDGKKKSDQPKNRSIERRFVALLDADADDLHYYLRQMIDLLKANNVAVNWAELFKAIRGWRSESRYVQKRWARSFWGSAETNKQTDPQPEGETE